MILFRSCPRCSGDRAVEGNQYGAYAVCLMCGDVAYPDEAGRLAKGEGP